MEINSLSKKRVVVSSVLKQFSCSASGVEQNWARGYKNFTLSDQYLSFWSLTQPESCFVHLGNTQQVKQSQTAAAHHSSCFQRCVGPLAAHHEHPVVSFLWDGQAVSQHISKQPNATEFTAAEGLVDMGSRKQPSVFTVHCQFSQRIPLKHQMTHWSNSMVVILEPLEGTSE